MLQNSNEFAIPLAYSCGVAQFHHLSRGLCQRKSLSSSSLFASLSAPLHEDASNSFKKFVIDPHPITQLSNAFFTHLKSALKFDGSSMSPRNLSKFFARISLDELPVNFHPKIKQINAELQHMKFEIATLALSPLRTTYSQFVSTVSKLCDDGALIIENQMNKSYLNAKLSSNRNTLLLKFQELERVKMLDHLPIKESLTSVHKTSLRVLHHLSQVTSGNDIPKVDLSSSEIELGDTLISSITVPLPRNPFDEFQLAIRTMFGKYPMIIVKFGDESVPLFCTEKERKHNTYRFFVPSTPLDLPRSEPLTVSQFGREIMGMVEIRDGRHKIYKKMIAIKHKDYPVESIWLSESKASLKPTEKEKKEIHSFLQMRSNKQLWKMPFLKPCDGEITTDYGLKRFYNGVFAREYYHKGIDYGAYTGEPVISPANGVIALIGQEYDAFEYHGNCIGIDHGHGIQSILMHLDSISVREGDFVRAGQVVGAVGETGIATGPHLHWGLYVCGKCVNPENWMRNINRL